MPTPTPQGRVALRALGTLGALTALGCLAACSTEGDQTLLDAAEKAA